LNKREAFLLRAKKEVLEGVRQWAAEDVRSLNHQIEFLLRRALIEAKRLPTGNGDSRSSAVEGAKAQQSDESEIRLERQSDPQADE
jgi:hypothetical protein